VRYNASAPATVTISLVDENDDELYTSTIGSLNAGDSYSYVPEKTLMYNLTDYDIDEYTVFDEDDHEFTIDPLLDGENLITVRYNKSQKATGVINYVGGDGTILESVPFDWTIGKIYTFRPEAIRWFAGEQYSVAAADDKTHALVMSQSPDDNVMTLRYNLVTGQMFTITVNMISQAENLVLLSEQYDRVKGTTFSYAPKLTMTSGSYKYVITPEDSMKREIIVEQDTVINLYYDRQMTVVINCLNSNTGDVLATTSVEKAVGTTYMFRPRLTITANGATYSVLAANNKEMSLVVSLDVMSNVINVMYEAYSGGGGGIGGRDPDVVDDSSNKAKNNNGNSNEDELWNLDFDALPEAALFLKEHVTFIKGYGDGTLRPDGVATRAEVAQMVYSLMADETKTEPAENVFSDIAGDEWHAQAINYLASQGYLNGYPDGSFNPNANMTRAEYATFLSQFGELIETDENVFADVSDDYWAVKYINSAYSKGWVTGYPDGTFKPNGQITRAEVIVVLNQIPSRAIDASSFERVTVVHDFTDIDESHWAFYAMMEAALDHVFTYGEHGEEWISQIEASNDAILDIFG
jgi:hypothetical protein